MKLASIARVAPSLLPKALHLGRKQSNASTRLLAGVIATLVTQSLLSLRRFDQARLNLFRLRRGSLRGKVTRPHRGGPLLAQEGLQEWLALPLGACILSDSDVRGR